MKILLTNDDGIDSAGIRLLASVLGLSHEVYICAPDGERSGHSHFLRFHQPITASKCIVQGAVEAYSISGSPADSVMFAIRQLKYKPDLVISGPNRGANVALDIIYSGTVGAAQEAAILGFKAIAISSCAYRDNIYESCLRWIEENLHKLAEFDYNKGVLNVNVPNLPYEQIKGSKVVLQGFRPYDDHYEMRMNGSICEYSLEGNPVEMTDTSDTIDVNAVANGYVAITPLTLDRNYYAIIKSAEDCFT